jgi:hypothetical protein
MTARQASVAKPRPRTGEPREVRQPLKIDKLPEDLHKEILELRSKEGLTWLAIEERSPRLDGWEKASAAQLAIFPGRRIPHSNLHRWFDLRIEQIQRQVLADTERAREFAAAFAGRSQEGLDKAVLNALRDQVFSLMQAVDSGSQLQFTKALMALGELITKFEKVAVQKQKAETEGKRVDIALEQLQLMKRKVGSLKDDLTKKKLTPHELQKKLDELYGIS